MSDMDVRWRQRFQNYRKAHAQLAEFILQGNLNKFERQGIIQCFEYTFELAWKTVKDYLEAEGFEVKSPRGALQTGFQTGLLPDGHSWMDALEKRNLMAHTYDEEKAEEAEALIKNRYYPILSALVQELMGK